MPLISIMCWVLAVTGVLTGLVLGKYEVVAASVIGFGFIALGTAITGRDGVHGLPVLVFNLVVSSVLVAMAIIRVLSFRH